MCNGVSFIRTINLSIEEIDGNYPFQLLSGMEIDEGETPLSRSLAVMQSVVEILNSEKISRNPFTSRDPDFYVFS